MEIIQSTVLKKEKRFTNFENVYSSGGISAGTYLSFEMVRKLHEVNVYNSMLEYLEYNISNNE